MDTMKLGTKQGSEGEIRAKKEGDFMDNSIKSGAKLYQNLKTLNLMKFVLACTLVHCCFCCFSIHPTFHPLGLWNKKLSQSTTSLWILWDFGLKLLQHTHTKFFPIYKQFVSLSFYLWNFAQKGKIQNDNFSKMNLFWGILSEASNQKRKNHQVAIFATCK
jgi:hypothetical protein